MTQQNKPPIYHVESADEEMLAAMKRARDAFAEFIAAIEADSGRLIPILEGAMVKAYFADAKDREGGEHLWLDYEDYDGNLIAGTVLSEPTHVRSVRQGDRVRVALADLSDWLFVQGGKAHGAYTVRLLRSRMTEAERVKHDSGYPFSFD